MNLCCIVNPFAHCAYCGVRYCRDHYEKANELWSKATVCIMAQCIKKAYSRMNKEAIQQSRKFLRALGRKEPVVHFVKEGDPRLAAEPLSCKTLCWAKDFWWPDKSTTIVEEVTCLLCLRCLK